jgi:uncharacterized membrane protein
MSLSQRYAALGIAALFALQYFWHGFLLPNGPASGWVIASLYALPIVPAVILLLLGHRRAPYWGAVAALLYFSHGVMEAWADPESRPLALTEVAVSVWLIVAYGWDGLQARLAKRKLSARDV